MSEFKSTKFIHDGIKMTDYEKEPFVVGDYENNEVEFLHLSHENWYTATPYPYQKRIFGYAILSRPGKVYIFGGCCDGEWSRVALFKNDKWSEAGTLIQGRMNLMTLKYGSDIMIIGGKTQTDTL